MGGIDTYITLGRSRETDASVVVSSSNVGAVTAGVRDGANAR